MQKQKTLMVSVVGVPNAGKSTLINNIINEKISAVSPKPHTTRTTVYGIYTQDDTQIVFMDTPGFMRSNMAVNNQGDLMCFIIDGLNPWAYGVREKIQNLLGKVELLIFINKIDCMNSQTYMEIMTELRNIGYHGEIGALAGMYKRGVEELKEKLMERALEYPWLFPADQKHTLTMQDIIKECIREKIFHISYHELPYDSEVVVKDLTFFIPERKRYAERGEYDNRYESNRHQNDVFNQEFARQNQEQKYNTRDHYMNVNDILKTQNTAETTTSAYESAAMADPRMEWMANVVIYVDKASQQQILVGVGGRMIKRISQSSRMELIDRFGYGQLFVKISLKP